MKTDDEPPESAIDWLCDTLWPTDRSQWRRLLEERDAAIRSEAIQSERVRILAIIATWAEDTRLVKWPYCRKCAPLAAKADLDLIVAILNPGDGDVD